MGAPYRTETLLGCLYKNLYDLYDNYYKEEECKSYNNNDNHYKGEENKTNHTHIVNNISLTINNYGKNELIEPISFIK